MQYITVVVLTVSWCASDNEALAGNQQSVHAGINALFAMYLE